MSKARRHFPSMSEIAPDDVPEAFRLAGAVIPIVLDLAGAMPRFGSDESDNRQGAKAPRRQKENKNISDPDLAALAPWRLGGFLILAWLRDPGVSGLSGCVAQSWHSG